jgi:hypothetical protein
LAFSPLLVSFFFGFPSKGPRERLRRPLLISWSE